jgi:succinate dehydrogenase/fumarate reductase flavoprotein subunit
MGKRLDEPGLELTTDVLVIGGGPAAAWSALAAREGGAGVVVVDKGYVGTSGAFAASTSGAKILPPLAVLRDPVKFERYALGGFLAQHRWWDRLLDETFVNAPKIWGWGGYDTPNYSDGKGYYRGLQGSETMRILRKRLLQVGVRILDQSPALELLVDEDGAVAGARGIQRQEDRPWTVRAGATVLASGGCAWLSKALGCNTNTGDGLLQAVEAGAELSGMEFSAHYSPAPIHSSVTKSAFYRYATYTDKDGVPLEGLSKNGHRSTSAIAKELLKGPVYCKLDKDTEKPETRQMLRLMQPNFFAAFDKIGLDPFEERWRITLLLEGTVRGTGGIRIANDECGTTVEGLFAAGDAATRELNCGGFTGGAGPNMTWAIGSGNISGRAAAAHAKALGAGASQRKVHGVGGAGLAPKTEGAPVYDNEAVVKGVQEEVFPYDKNIFRTEAGLVDSLAKLAKLWEEVQGTPVQETSQDVQRSREVAALVAAARWSYFSGLERKETRGMHKRLDYPKLDPEQRHYLAVGGLDKLWTRPVPVPEAIVPEPAKDETEVHV